MQIFDRQTSEISVDDNHFEGENVKEENKKKVF